MQNKLQTSNTPKKLPIGDILKEAAQKIYGVKKIFFYAFLIYAAIAIPMNILQRTVNYPIAVGVLSFIISSLLSAGFLYLGIRRSFNLPIKVKMLFTAFRPKLAVKTILITLFIVSITFILGFTIAFLFSFFTALLNYHPEKVVPIGKIIPIGGGLLGFYIGIRLSLAVTILMAQQKISSWQAIKMSFNATKNNFWRLTLLMFIIIFLVLAGLVTLGIGLIWALPFTLIVWGLVYQYLVGTVFEENIL